MKTGIIIGAAVLATAGIANGGFVVLDQIGATDGSDLTGNAVASQINSPALFSMNVAAIDNFTVGGSTTIVEFAAMLSGWASTGVGGAPYGGAAGVTEFNLEVYSSPVAAATNLTGDIASMVFGAPSSTSLVDAGLGLTGPTELVTFDVSLDLGPGEYWFALAPRNDVITNGHTGIRRTTIGDGIMSFLANPGGGFGFGPLASIGTTVDPSTGLNLAYRVLGESVPAPSALALLGLAAIGTRRRRRV